MIRRPGFTSRQFLGLLSSSHASFPYPIRFSPWHHWCSLVQARNEFERSVSQFACQNITDLEFWIFVRSFSNITSKELFISGHPSYRSVEMHQLAKISCDSISRFRKKVEKLLSFHRKPLFLLPSLLGPLRYNPCATVQNWEWLAIKVLHSKASAVK